METVATACEAMATRFEFVLHGERTVALRAAAEEAIREIQRLHAQLSLYLPTSEISYINARASRGPVKVEPRLFSLLRLAQRLHRETEGAFDITIAPLMRCWGFMRGQGKVPSQDQLAEARERVGMHHVILDEKRITVQFAREGVMIDLGSIGKGFALEMAMEILQEAGVQSALIHGGTSTVCALGAPPDGPWKIAIEPPPEMHVNQSSANATTQEKSRPLAVVELHNRALSVSGVHGKYFRADDGKVYGHVIDPRTGQPGQSALLAAATMPSAAETDAFSTALLLGGLAKWEKIAERKPGMGVLVVERDSREGGLVTQHRGADIRLV